jgi:hypothetical protein
VEFIPIKVVNQIVQFSDPAIAGLAGYDSVLIRKSSSFRFSFCFRKEEKGTWDQIGGLWRRGITRIVFR